MAITDEDYPSIANWRQVLSVLDLLYAKVERLEKALLVMQPKYHTLMHTFKNEAEAQMAWQALHITLYGPDKPIPPMPVGPEHTSPYLQKGNSPVRKKHSERFEGIDIGDTNSH
jgi:hypothetical protein